MISIIVPFEVVERQKLDLLITSFLKQTNKNFEVIFIDIGNNKSFNYKDYFKRLGFRFYTIDSENINLGKAKDYGVKVASGTHVWFVDVHDYLKENAIEFLENQINKNKNIDFVYFGFESPNILKKNNIFIDENKSNILTKDSDLSFFNDFFKYGEQKDFRVCFEKSFLTDNEILHHENLSLYDDIYFSLINIHYFKRALFVNKKIYVSTKVEKDQNNNYLWEQKYKALYAAYIKLIHMVKNEKFFWYILQNYLPIVFNLKFTGIKERKKIFSQYTGKYYTRSIKTLHISDKWLTSNLISLVWIITGFNIKKSSF